jgi:hypothetical protein
MFLSLMLTALMLSSASVNLNENIEDLPRKHPLGQYLPSDRTLIAEKVEDQLVLAGLSARMARAATINAYAESRLDPTAIGDNGRSVGIFQLSSLGLGSKMSIEQRMDVKVSTAKIARTVLKDKVLMDMQRECASLEDMVKAFTIRVERPSNSKQKARDRAKISETIHQGQTVDCESNS